MTEREIVKQLLTLTSVRISFLNRAMRISDGEIYASELKRLEECKRWLGKKANEMNQADYPDEFEK